MQSDSQYGMVHACMYEAVQCGCCTPIEHQSNTIPIIQIIHMHVLRTKASVSCSSHLSLSTRNNKATDDSKHAGACLVPYKLQMHEQSELSMHDHFCSTSVRPRFHFGATSVPPRFHLGSTSLIAGKPWKHSILTVKICAL